MDFSVATFGLAFAAGGLSTLSPCVLPLIPILLGTAIAAHRLGPFALAGGLALSFTLVGVLIASVGVALGHHTRDLQRRLDTRQSIPTGDSLKLARDTKERVAAVERLAGAFLHPRWPAALTGEHRDGANLQRLEQALARWDLQAHRSLAALPTTANLTWTARVQQDVVVVQNPQTSLKRSSLAKC